MKNVTIEFISMENIEKGHLTKMWNQLYKLAYNEGYEYFYQSGDDIEYKSKGWIKKCIKSLQLNNNIGIAGPYNGHPYLLTQVMITRKHYDIFGYLFPEEIKNWYCDDWINELYYGINPKYRITLINDKCINIGGEPRYSIVHSKQLYKLLVVRDIHILQEYLRKNGIQ